MSLRIFRKWISNFVTTILFLVLLVMVFVVVSSKASGGEPQIFGYELKTVLSGSMEPGIKTGSIIAVKPGGDMNRFKTGDVITFKLDEKKIITHRIIEVSKVQEQVIYKTKGDNNKSPDINPVLSQNVVAEYNGFTIPYLGYFISFTNSKNGAFLLIIPGLFLLLYSALTIWKAISHLDSRGNKDDIGKTV
ncbi:signal peptidase I SipW [Neobacillus drentensis]|uniref:signal peptidase I SipW n=1 Tax=Neobacillus drentensis TaxID=220684 RepID=UPI002FFFBC16